jgi:EpsI family protein
MDASPRHPRVIALGILALAAWLVWAGRAPIAGSPQPAADVPAALGPWTGTTLEVTDRTVAVLETDDVTLMEYRMGDEPPVWFAQVAGFGTRAAYHPPELCYVGSHYEVLDRGVITVLVGSERRRVMRLLIGQDKERFEAWYWFTANGRTTPSYYRQQLWLVMDSMRRRPMSGTLVRISTPIDRAPAAHRRLLAFITAFEGAGHSGRQLARHDGY